MAKKRLIIVGNSTAGLSALEAIHQTGFDHEVVVISQESYPSYSPTVLPHLLAGEIAEKDLFMHGEPFYAARNASLMLGKRVVRIRPDKSKITLEDGQELAFDELLVAVGASPAIPPLKGLDSERALALRTLDDAKKLMASAQGKRRAVILGAGLIGLQSVLGLRGMGLETTVVEKKEQILPLYLEPEPAETIRKSYEARGVTFFLGATIEQVEEGGKRILLSSGEELKADLLLIAIGVHPRLNLLEGSDIEVDEGILVKESMETNYPHIYAAGDVAQAKDFFTDRPVLNPIMPSAAEQGKVAGLNMAGIKERYEGTLSMNILSYFGNIAFFIGSVFGAEDGYESYVKRFLGEESYQNLIFRGDQLVGAVVINQKVDPGIVYSLIKNRTVLTHREKAEVNTRPLAKSRRLFLRSEEEAKHI